MTSHPTVLCKEGLHAICLPFRLHSNNREVDFDSKAFNAALGGANWERLTAQNETDIRWDRLQNYQAKAYFHPFVRSFLYEGNLVRRYRRGDISKFDVAVDSTATGQQTVSLTVKRCELTLFQPDIGVLLLELELTEPLPLQLLQLVMDTLRRIYPPYFDCFSPHVDASTNNDDTAKKDTWVSGHCPVSVSVFNSNKHAICAESTNFRNHTADFTQPYLEVLEKPSDPDSPPQSPWAPHWRHVLSPFVDDGEFQAISLGDDRAPTLSWLAMEKPREISRGDWMRLCFADAPGNDSLPYAKEFATDFEKRFCYDRYWYKRHESTDGPSRILNCGYAFAYVGDASDKYFFTKRENGGHATFRHIYIQMGVIAHFQHAALLAASQRLSTLIKRENGSVCLPDTSKVKEFYEHFISFTQTYWFDEITPQEQGRELFQMWRTHLRLQEQYDEIRQELKDLVDYTELKASKLLNDKLKDVAIAGLIIAFVALLIGLASLGAGIFGMNEAEQLQSLANVPLGPLTRTGLYVAGFLMIAVVVTAGWLIKTHRLFRKPRGNRR